MNPAPPRILASLLALALPGSALAVTWHVPGDAPTVQAGIDLSAAGDTVRVSSGTYSEAVQFRGSAVVVLGSGSASTTLSGNGVDPTVRFALGEPAGTVLADFTVTGGSSGIVCENGSSPLIRDCALTLNFADGYGGGLRCNASSPTISGCTVTLNSAQLDGGGLYCSDASPAIESCSIDDNIAPRGAGVFATGLSTPSLEGCTIQANSATWGGGLLALSGADLQLTDCVIESNQALDSGAGLYVQAASATLLRCEIALNNTDVDGGGVYLRPNSDLQASNCVINDNDALGSGGGLYVWNSSSALTHCIVARNSAGFRGGAAVSTGSTSTLLNCVMAANSPAPQGGGIYSAWWEPVTVTNSILWGNTPEQIYNHLVFPAALTVSYSDVEDGWSGEQNMDANPRFRDYGQYDFILAPASPCIDAGTGGDDGLDWCSLHAQYCQFNSQAPDLGAYGGPGMAGWLD